MGLGLTVSAEQMDCYGPFSRQIRTRVLSVHRASGGVMSDAVGDGVWSLERSPASGVVRAIGFDTWRLSLARMPAAMPQGAICE